jgi:hypothetical protein
LDCQPVPLFEEFGREVVTEIVETCEPLEVVSEIVDSNISPISQELKPSPLP